MDNELRKKRVLEGIKLLEKGVDPTREWKMYSREFTKYLGLSNLGTSILYINGMFYSKKIMEDNGFVYSTHGICLLHNWKRFYELIKDL